MFLVWGHINTTMELPSFSSIPYATGSLQVWRSHILTRQGRDDLLVIRNKSHFLVVFSFYSKLPSGQISQWRLYILNLEKEKQIVQVNFILGLTCSPNFYLHTNIQLRLNYDMALWSFYISWIMSQFSVFMVSWSWKYCSSFQRSDPNAQWVIENTKCFFSC